MLQLPIIPAFSEKNLAISLETSDYFAPYASVTLLSIIEHISPEYHYDFLVFTWDMQEENALKMTSMADGKDNVSIRVIDVSNKIRYYAELAKQRKDYDRFSAAGIVRLLFPRLLENYDVVLNFDCDMLICSDVSELFQYDLTDYYMGAVRDMIIYAIAKNNPNEIYTNNLVFNKLKLSSLDEYLNAGLLLLNLKKMRLELSQKEIIDYARDDGSFYRCYEQDAFNGLFSGHKLVLPPEWNWFVDAAKIISGAKTRISSCDINLKNYYAAENGVKNYHFLTKYKPWQDAEKVPYSNKWWNAARKSPFFNDILLRTDNRMESNRSNTNKQERRLLFFCETPYQLMNILNLKYYYYPNDSADLILARTTEVFRYKEKLEKQNIFSEIIMSDYDGKVDGKKILTEYSLEERSLNPEKYEKILYFEKNYTDYFIPTCLHAFQQMLYYQMIKSGINPSVFIYEEGATTYTDHLQAEMNQYIHHELYSKTQQMVNNVKAVFLYRPDFYIGKSAIKKLPLIQATDSESEYIDMLHHVFGKITLPDEKYLFFDEPFAEDGFASNHLQILDSIAELVGKENISVKIHPRSKTGEELYRVHGFSIFSDNSTPWEIAAFDADITNKVFISVTSNTIWTPSLVFEKKEKNNVICLAKIMKLSKRFHARVPEYWKLLWAVLSDMNKEKRRFYMPDNLQELKNILQFIEGEA